MMSLHDGLINFYLSMLIFGVIVLFSICSFCLYRFYASWMNVERTRKLWDAFLNELLKSHLDENFSDRMEGLVSKIFGLPCRRRARILGRIQYSDVTTSDNCDLDNVEGDENGTSASHSKKREEIKDEHTEQDLSSQDMEEEGGQDMSSGTSTSPTTTDGDDSEEGESSEGSDLLNDHLNMYFPTTDFEFDDMECRLIDAEFRDLDDDNSIRSVSTGLFPKDLREEVRSDDGISIFDGASNDDEIREIIRKGVNKDGMKKEIRLPDIFCTVCSSYAKETHECLFFVDLKSITMFHQCRPNPERLGNSPCPYIWDLRTDSAFGSVEYVGIKQLSVKPFNTFYPTDAEAEVCKAEEEYDVGQYEADKDTLRKFENSSDEDCIVMPEFVEVPRASEEDLRGEPGHFRDDDCGCVIREDFMKEYRIVGATTTVDRNCKDWSPWSRDVKPCRLDSRCYSYCEIIEDEGGGAILKKLKTFEGLKLFFCEKERKLRGYDCVFLGQRILDSETLRNAEEEGVSPDPSGYLIIVFGKRSWDRQEVRSTLVTLPPSFEAREVTSESRTLTCGVCDRGKMAGIVGSRSRYDCKTCLEESNQKFVLCEYHYVVNVECIRYNRYRNSPFSLHDSHHEFTRKIVKKVPAYNEGSEGKYCYVATVDIDTLMVGNQRVISSYPSTGYSNKIKEELGDHLIPMFSFSNKMKSNCEYLKREWPRIMVLKNDSFGVKRKVQEYGSALIAAEYFLSLFSMALELDVRAHGLDVSRQDEFERKMLKNKLVLEVNPDFHMNRDQSLCLWAALNVRGIESYFSGEDYDFFNFDSPFTYQLKKKNPFERLGYLRKVVKKAISDETKKEREGTSRIGKALYDMFCSKRNIAFGLTILFTISLVFTLFFATAVCVRHFQLKKQREYSTCFYEIPEMREACFTNMTNGSCSFDFGNEHQCSDIRKYYIPVRLSVVCNVSSIVSDVVWVQKEKALKKIRGLMKGSFRRSGTVSSPSGVVDDGDGDGEKDKNKENHGPGWELPGDPPQPPPGVEFEITQYGDVGNMVEGMIRVCRNLWKGESEGLINWMDFSNFGLWKEILHNDNRTEFFSLVWEYLSLSKSEFFSELGKGACKVNVWDCLFKSRDGETKMCFVGKDEDGKGGEQYADEIFSKFASEADKRSYFLEGCEVVEEDGEKFGSFFKNRNHCLDVFRLS